CSRGTSNRPGPTRSCGSGCIFCDDPKSQGALAQSVVSARSQRSLRYHLGSFSETWRRRGASLAGAGELDGSLWSGFAECLVRNSVCDRQFCQLALCLAFHSTHHRLPALEFCARADSIGLLVLP